MTYGYNPVEVHMSKFTTRENALELTPEFYLRMFYRRPNTNQWDMYKEALKDKMKLIKECFDSWDKWYGMWPRCITAHYSKLGDGNYEVTVIIDFGELDSDIKEKFYHDIHMSDAYWPPLHDGLGQAECQYSFNVIGQQTVKLVINESY